MLSYRITSEMISQWTENDFHSSLHPFSPVLVYCAHSLSSLSPSFVRRGLWCVKYSNMQPVNQLLLSLLTVSFLPPFLSSLSADSPSLKIRPLSYPVIIACFSFSSPPHSHPFHNSAVALRIIRSSLSTPPSPLS